MKTVISSKIALILLVVFFLNKKTIAQTTLFSESFSTNSFATNGWTFPYGQGNWSVTSFYTPTVSSAPTALFFYTPTILNYSIALQTTTINATSISGPVYLSCALRLQNLSSTGTGTEFFAIQYKNIAASTWSTLTTYTNNLAGYNQNFITTNALLPGMTGQNFQIRFTVYGASSYNINGWGLDDILVTGATCPSSLPNLTITASPTLCAGSSTTLSAIGGGTSYTWSPTGGNSLTAVVSPTTTTSYALISDYPGCTATAVLGIVTLSVINNPATITVVNSSSAICAGNSVTLSASGATSYSWNTGASTSSIVVTPTSTGVYTVSNTNSVGCVALQASTISVNPNPVLSIYSSNSVTCSGTANNLIASGASTYTWSNNANTSIITVSPQVTTTYTLMGTNAQGCSSTKTVTALVSPVVSVVASNTSICFGSTVTLSSSGANTYTWSNSSNANSIVVNPAISSVYTVIATDINGCVTSASISVLVNANPTVSAVSSSSSICTGNSATLTASGASTYTWNNLSTGSSITVSPVTNTTYSVVGISANGCAGTNNAVIINLSVFPSPTVTAVSSGSIVCAGSNLTLTANGASTYSWNFGATTNVATVSPLSSTIYTVTGTNSQFCSSTATVNVNVLPSPSLSIASSSTNLCVGETATLLANGAQTYTWNTGANVNVIYVSPLTNTVYTINATGTNGCMGTETISLIVNQYPTITVNSSDTLICSGESVNLNVSGALSYTWSNSMTGSSITVTPLTTATYTVIGSNNGCNSNIIIVQKVDECTGIDKHTNTQNFFSVFPNPNNGLVTVLLNALTSKTHLKLYSLSGQLLLSQEMNTEKYLLDLSEQAAGIYYLKIVNTDTQGVLKIIKE